MNDMQIKQFLNAIEKIGNELHRINHEIFSTDYLQEQIYELEDEIIRMKCGAVSLDKTKRVIGK